MQGYVHRTFSPAEGNGRIVKNNDGDTIILGYEEADGVFVPNPARRKPKPGHWRVSPGAKLKPHRKGCDKRGITLDHALNSNRVDGDYVREESRREESKRARKRRILAALREDGHI